VTSTPAPSTGDIGTSRRRRFRGARALADRTPLRVKLVASVLLLVTVGLFVAGTAASHYLRSYLVNRVDSQLRVGPLLGGPQPGPATSAPTALTEAQINQLISQACTNRVPDQFRRNNTRYVSCTDLNGKTVAHDTTPSSGYVPALPKWSSTRVAEQASRPFTVGSVGGGPEWRVRAAVVGDTVIYEANSLSDVDSTVSRLEVDELVIGAIVLVLVAGLGYWVVRSSLKPLTDVEHTAAAIADGDLSRRVPHRDPRTEVGRLALAVNGMLSQIEMSFRIRRASEEEALASEQRMRRFVTDASHELRTPLTSIRGFAELYRQGAAGNPDDIARLLRRIEDEAARMGLLVDDLLLLARLDQQRPLEREIVDLMAVAADSVHAAQAVAPQRPISLEAIDGPTPPEVIGDESRLRQVVGNLVTNAITHTPPGTPITVRVGSRVQAGALYGLVEVADQGPGLDAEAAGKVFERFYRADPSRTRSLGGTGLGLSIVAALVAAHGGRVELDTEVGEGATFRVLLPALPEAELPEAELPDANAVTQTPAAGEVTAGER
jgi:two-component system OmpR family sensor kinase